MKAGWETTKLGDLLDVQNGYAFSSKDYSASGHFVMRIGNVQNGYISLTDPKYINLPANGTLQRFVLSNGDVLVSLTGNVGRIGVIQKEHLPAALNQRVARLTIREGSPACREFLLFFLYSDWFREELTGAGHGAAQQNVSTKDLVEIQLPVPPLAEQRRIVGILDEAFEGLATAKANAEKNLQNARALFEGHLQSVFTQRGRGWVEKPFEDCIEDVKYTTKIQRKDSLAEGEFPIISQEADFTNGYWNNAADVFKVTRPVVIFGDHTQVLKYIDFDFVLGADGVKILLPKTFLNPKFLFYALRSAPLKSLGYARHYRLLKELQISHPDVEKQVAIAEKLDVLDAETQRLESLYQRKLAALDELKKSLLHRAFSGQL